MVKWILHPSLKGLNTFGIDARAERLVHIRSEKELQELLPEYNAEKTLILGGGSNVLFLNDWPGDIWLVALPGIQVLEENEEHVRIRAAAGENWHGFVTYCVQKGWGGLENLSLIPGKVGAAPMQNIGAYGVEVKDRIVSVHAIELHSGKKLELASESCAFGYRCSIFKTELKGKVLITAVEFLLDKNPQINTRYGAIRTALENAGINPENAGISDVAEAVIGIRRTKLPDPWLLGNAGSFFKNPVIPEAQACELDRAYPELVSFPEVGERRKLAAGWLIEKAGWKGFRKGDVGVHEKQALVLVNYGNATGYDIYRLALDIQKDVFEKFRVQLQPEVNIIGVSG